MIEHGRYRSGDLDGRTSQLFHARVWHTADDLHPGCGHGGDDVTPHFTAKPFHTTDVRLPVHGAEEHHDWLFRFGARDRSELLEIDAGRNDDNASRLGELRELGTIVFRYGDHTMKSADGPSFEPLHSARLDVVGEPFQRMTLCLGSAAPEYRLDVVLEQDRRSGERLRKVARWHDEIADRDVKLPSGDQSGHESPYFATAESRVRKWLRRGEAPQVLQPTRECRGIGNARVHGERSRQQFGDVALVLQITTAGVVRKKRNLVTRGQLPEQVERPDLSSGVDRQELIRIDPENLHVTGSLPANSLVPHRAGDLRPICVHEVDDDMSIRELRFERAKFRRAIADDDDVTRVEDLSNAATHERPDVRDLALDVLLVRADEARTRHLAIVNGELQSLADQLLDQCHHRRFAEVVRSGLE